MPHYPEPFFRKSRGLWYVQLEGTQHNLGPACFIFIPAAAMMKVLPAVSEKESFGFEVEPLDLIAQKHCVSSFKSSQ